MIRDRVTDVSSNYEKARGISSFTPPKELQPGECRMAHSTSSVRGRSVSASNAFSAKTSAT